MTRKAVALTVVAGFVMSSMLLAREKELNVVLKWNPNEKQGKPVLDTTGGIFPLAIAGIVDKRDKGKQIGENTEKDTVPIYTSSDVPAFVRDHVVSQLKIIGIEVTAAETGDRVLKSELIDFWVAEGNRYQGSVRLRISIVDSKGKELWSGAVGGSSNNFGRSLKPDNYTESISDCIQDLASTLVSTPAFREAIAKTPKPSAR